MNSLSELAVENIEIWTSSQNVKRSGRGRSTNPKSNLYGVSKLRDLILELAIKGRLVTQDESEDPAENILKKIELDRVKPNALGARPKRKSVSKISRNIDSVKLPVGWTIACLGDVVEIIRGITFPGSEKSRLPEPGRIACLRTTNVQDQIDWDDLLYIGEKFVSRENQLLKPKDIVMSMANSRELVGKVALVNAVSEKTTFGGFLGVLRTSSINPDFLMIFLRAPSTRSSLIESSSQTTNIANISLAKLNPLVFAIPPLAEQGRIANKVNELMTICDQLEAKSISSISANEQLTLSLLHGLLASKSNSEVAEPWGWMENNFDVLFNSEECIAFLKSMLIDLVMMGCKHSSASDWKKLKLKDVIDRMDSGWSPACLNNPSSSNSRWGVLKTTAVQYLDYLESENKELPDNLSPRLGAEVAQGDILFTRAGPANRVGISCFVHKTRPKLMISDKIIRFRALESLILGEFLVLAINCDEASRYLRSAKSGMAESQVNISQSKLSLTPISFPSIDEQKLILSRINKLFLLCDQLKSKISESDDLQRKITDVLVDRVLI